MHGFTVKNTAAVSKEQFIIADCFSDLLVQIHRTLTHLGPHVITDGYDGTSSGDDLLDTGIRTGYRLLTGEIFGDAGGFVNDGPLVFRKAVIEIVVGDQS